MPITETTLTLDFDACYRAASGRDARWDGRVYLGVTSTGIYCRPSCPARKPKPENCRFFGTAAACVAAGFRACKRCRPDAVPGTRDWDARGDLVARAVRRIRDGAIDSSGVAGLASELAVSERHLRRMLLDGIGATPLQLARTRRAHAARALIEQTDLSLADVAFAAGFGSVRQFGDTMREEFGVAPSELPRRGPGSHGAGSRGAGSRNTESATPVSGDPVSDERPRIPLRLRTRAPFDPGAMRAFLLAHAIPGRDQVSSAGTTGTPDVTGITAHAVDVPGGTAVVRIDWDEIPTVAQQAGAHTVGIPVVLTLPELADTMPAIQKVRRMLDLDADPGQIAEAFSADPLLAPLRAARPGLRLPGARDPHEFALATVLGQQVSLAAARTLQGRLAAAFTGPGPGASGVSAAGAGSGPADPAPAFLPRVDVTRIATRTAAELQTELRITGARAETLRALAAALAGGLDLGPGADRDRARAELAAIRGVGPWTVELIAMRALGDPDAYPAGDLILRRALGVEKPRDAELLAESWRPFRGYATQHLWADFLAEAARKDTK
ncbi:DNA-3-methyladenine glycosylase 2 family protein [Leucobacter luti]|uniref:DNA-3-methyladenine glycosylase 2 family protein n=1 Tax=Leucobacter luti TaxID=340320 RepID=UPI001C68D456|nr:Ada metal-binding domain-containing protein [Leucobacter luti]QYM74688.1 helix-turn-helix domain-containing protein [Leucobacter luti]